MLAMSLRERLVAVTLEWEQTFGVAPGITSAVAELDVALLVGHSEGTYATACAGRTAVSPGWDVTCPNGVRYQVKANRPSGKPGSSVTLVARPKNFEWDRLVWVLYDPAFTLLEAWQWERDAFREAFVARTRLSPGDMRRGEPLLRR